MRERDLDHTQCVRFARFIGVSAGRPRVRHPNGRTSLTVSLVASSCSHRYPPVITAGMGKSRMRPGAGLVGGAGEIEGFSIFDVGDRPCFFVP